MSRVLVIGTGQLGSRHLQALKKVDSPLQILAVDPSPDSLRVAKERYESFPGVPHPIEYQTMLPSGLDLDLVILATNAGPRYQLMEQLLTSCRVRSLVAEKILFPKIEQYEKALTLLSRHKVSAWVNCPMRQMPVYRQIRDLVSGQEIQMNVTGSQFGLVTNAIHYVDCLSWMSGSSKFQLGLDGLSQNLIASKRLGYTELNGVIQATFENGSGAHLRCFADGALPVVVEIMTPRSRFIVKESEGLTLAWSSENMAWAEWPSRIPYQSELTAMTAQGLLSQGLCELPRFEESCEIHLNLLRPLVGFLQRTQLRSDHEIPFT